MSETVLVLIGKNDETRELFVEERTFGAGSEEAKKANEKYVTFFNFARKYGYRIICKNYRNSGEDFEIYQADKNKIDKSSLKDLESELKEEKKKLLEIKQKDLTELTEEEIILLAQSRVHGEHFISGGQLAIGKATTFEGEYQKIKDAIEQKKSSNVYSDEQSHRPHM